MSKTRELFPDAANLSDKGPDNFLHLGLVKAIFPRALRVGDGMEPMHTNSGVRALLAKRALTPFFYTDVLCRDGWLLQPTLQASEMLIDMIVDTVVGGLVTVDVNGKRIEIVGLVGRQAEARPGDFNIVEFDCFTVFGRFLLDSSSAVLLPYHSVYSLYTELFRVSSCLQFAKSLSKG